MFFDLKIETRGDELNARLWMKNRCRRDKRVVIRSCNEGKDSGAGENRTNDSSWPDFTNEDYIEFSFGEDGEFDLVKNGKSEATNHLDFKISTSLKSVNRKLKFGENGEMVKNLIHDECSNEYGNSINSTTSDIKEVYDDYENFYPTTESITMVQEDSSDSDQSNGSSDSFNFPVLSSEWYGSPVKMPQSQGLELRKQKARCVGFQCWKSKMFGFF